MVERRLRKRPIMQQSENRALSSIHSDECDPLVRNMRKRGDGLVAGELQHN